MEKRRKVLHEQRETFVDLVEIGKEVMRVAKQQCYVRQEIAKQESPKPAILFLEHSYNTQLCDAYYLLQRELLRRGILGYLSGVQMEKCSVVPMYEIGKQIVVTVKRWKGLMRSVNKKKLGLQAYCTARFEYERQLFQLRNALLAALWDRGLLTALHKRAPCLKCGSKDLCRHKPLERWQVQMYKEKQATKPATVACVARSNGSRNGRGNEAPPIPFKKET